MRRAKKDITQDKKATTQDKKDKTRPFRTKGLKGHLFWLCAFSLGACEISRVSRARRFRFRSVEPTCFYGLLIFSYFNRLIVKIAITNFNFCIIVNYVILSCICSVNSVKIIKLENLKLEKYQSFP